MRGILGVVSKMPPVKFVGEDTVGGLDVGVGCGEPEVSPVLSMKDVSVS